MTTIRRVLGLFGALAAAASMWQCSSGTTNGGMPDLATSGGYPDLGTTLPDMALLAAPTLTALAPATASTAGGAMLTLTGSGFQPGANVTVAGVACTNSTITATQIRCTIPKNAGKCGAQAVVITNSDNQSVTNLAGTTPFAYSSNGPGLGTPTMYTVGAAPQNLIIGDFNGDKKMDLVTVSQQSSISLLTGKGDGTFNAMANTALMANAMPANLALADLNNDTKLDVVTINRAGTGSISVLLGDGVGGFAAPVNTSVMSGSLTSVVFGNFVPSSLGDVLTADSMNNTLSIYPGNGTGGFGTPVVINLPSGASSPETIATGDFNGDKKPDVVVANYGASGVMPIFLGNGMATVFGAATTVSMAPSPAVVIADLNKDNKLDVVIAGASNSAYVRLGDGAGGFGGANPPAVFAAGIGQLGIEATTAFDIDGDGNIDLVTANSLGQSISILPGNGDGTFKTPVTFAAGVGVAGIVAADFNGDGFGDVATVAPGATNAVVMLGKCQ